MLATRGGRVQRGDAIGRGEGFCERCRCCGAGAVLLMLAVWFFPAAALAYTAAGDRIFAATGILPQIAPSDQFYTWGGMQPLAGGAVGAPRRATTFGAAYEKTITERLGIHLEDVWAKLDRTGAGSLYGFQNFETELKYLAVNNHEHELLLTLSASTANGAAPGRA